MIEFHLLALWTQNLYKSLWLYSCVWKLLFFLWFYLWKWCLDHFRLVMRSFLTDFFTISRFHKNIVLLLWLSDHDSGWGSKRWWTTISQIQTKALDENSSLHRLDILFQFCIQPNQSYHNWKWANCCLLTCLPVQHFRTHTRIQL